MQKRSAAVKGEEENVCGVPVLGGQKEARKYARRFAKPCVNAPASEIRRVPTRAARLVDANDATIIPIYNKNSSDITKSLRKMSVYALKYCELLFLFIGRMRARET